MQNFLKRNWPFIIFIAFESVFFFIIEFSHVSSIRPFAFSSIVLCFLFSLLMTRKLSLLLLGQFFTVVADFFLALPPTPNQIPGMVAFVCAQFCYCLFLLKQNERIKVPQIIVRVSLLVIAIIICFIVLKDKADALAIISIFYFTMMVLNMVFSFFSFKKNILFSIGFILFFLCDLYTGFNSGLLNYISVPETSLFYKIMTINFNMVWLFYLPSQILLTLFTISFAKNK